MARDYVQEVTGNLEQWLKGDISGEAYEAERERIASTLADGSVIGQDEEVREREGHSVGV